MPEFLEDPSVLTKDKLKSALVANNVALPNGDQRKGVYVELYLKNLTSRNKRSSAAPDSFSSDEELPAPVLSNKSRSGRKATRKTDKNRPEELDVTELTNEGLKDQLLKYGINAGPIVASKRMLYEKELQKLLDQGPPQMVLQISEPAITDGSLNGNTDSDQYSDNEEETTKAVPKLDPEPEPVPMVERPLRSRGKTPVTTRTRSGQNKIEKLSAVEQTPKTRGGDLLKELFPHDTLSTPTGISVTPRQPIKGAASRAFKDAWPDELRPRLTEFRHSSSSTYTENRSTTCTNPVLLNSIALSTVPKPAEPLAVQAKTQRRLPVWVQLLLLSALAGFLFFVYQAMETNEMSPFSQSVSSGSLDGISK